MKLAGYLEPAFGAPCPSLSTVDIWGAGGRPRPVASLAASLASTRRMPGARAAAALADGQNHLRKVSGIPRAGAGQGHLSMRTNHGFRGKTPACRGCGPGLEAEDPGITGDSHPHVGPLTGPGHALQNSSEALY